MRTKYWFHTLPGIVAVLGWVTIFVYALLLKPWWAMVAVFVVTLLAGALNLAVAMQTQRDKKTLPLPPLPPLQGPSVH